MGSRAIGVSIDPEDVPRRLAGFAVQLMDMRPFFASKGRQHGRRWLREHFDSEGEWGGWAWPELSPAYAAWKLYNVGDMPLLQLTGGLRAAVRSPRTRTGPDFLELSIEHELAEIHHFGAPGANIPPRPITPRDIPGDAIDALTKDVEEWVDDIAKRWGLT